MLQKLENTLSGWYKKTPPLPENARKSIAQALWWIALVIGILQLWAAWNLWQLAHNLEVLNRAVGYVNEYYDYTLVESNTNFFYYLAVIVIVVDAIILLLAAPALKAFKAAGWKLVFYSLLVNVVYGVVRMFSDVGGGLGVLVWSVVVTAIAAYFVFQVRDNFKGDAIASHKTTHPTNTKPHHKRS